MTALRKMIESASEAAGELFERQGGLHPFWHCVSRSGDHDLVPAPRELNKEAAAILMRAFMRERDTVRCCFVSEAWNVREKRDEAGALKLRDLSAHPRREEVVMFMAEDEEAGAMLGRRPILRDGRPRLGPLEILAPSETQGRFTSMLPRRGPLQ